MRVIACGPASRDFPYCPSAAVLDDGSVVHEDGPEPFVTEPVAPFDLPEGAWFAVCEDGSADVFLKLKSREWKAARAEALVTEASSLKGDPLRSLSLLRAAAALVGIPLADLLLSVRAAREPGETLAGAFEKIRAGRSSQGR